jgi:adenylyl cyclase-associated protein
VKRHHNNGVTWNNKDGVDAKEALKQVESSQNFAAGGAPPPPPPPPPLPNFQETPPPATKSSEGAMDAVFEQLSKGEAVTAGLKKVDKSQMTHKNPSLRATAPVPTRSDSSGSMGSTRAKSPAPPGKKPKPESMRTKKPARKELAGNKWYFVCSNSHQVFLSISLTTLRSIATTKLK